MSGGSMDYAYHKVESAASDILSNAQHTPLHLALAKHLLKVSKALHDLEWVYSGDCSHPSEVESIRAVLSPSDEIDSAREEAVVALKNLQEAIEYSRKKK